ncbi:MAG: ubiquinol-cytochrome c reductase iron-sulfur subunit [Acidobacteria bacterium]|nr:ubiquinol-cytochrome c reductase iron-sulfur subunit [Acidobacteriota bacterium]
MSTEHHTPVSLSSVKDTDPHMQPAAKNPEKVERRIAWTLVLGLVSFIGFGWTYWIDAAPWTLGATLGAGFTFIGVGMVAWGKYLMPKGPFVEERHPLRSSDEERDAFASVIANRGGSVVKRRPLLGALLGGGMGVFGVVALFPLLRSLGPLPKKTLTHTDWKKGSYLVTQDGRRVHVDDFIVNEVATVFPEGFQDTENGQAVDQTIVIRLDTEDYVTMKGRETWAPAGYVAYSKLCSHLGCPVGLYEQSLQLLVCPCHQSMFDVTVGAMPNFGPAPRPLPQLPLYIDRDGYLRSQSDYNEPVGPGYWERS